MTARFGGRVPTHSHTKRFRLFLGAVGMLCTVLLSTLVVLLTSAQPERSVEPVATLQPVPRTTVEIVTARQRIEEGEALREEFLDSLELPVEKLPEGSILYRDRHNVIGMFATRLINTSTPILHEGIRKDPPISELSIPDGFRATTLVLDQRAGAGGWATPKTRVDVLCTYRDTDGQMKVQTIVRFAKVLSVNRCTKSEICPPVSSGNDNITLLVSEKDARGLELARAVGTLSLIRVSDRVSQPSGGIEAAITIDQLFGTQRSEAPPQERPAGTITWTDPSTGRAQQKQLFNGRWRDGNEL